MPFLQRQSQVQPVPNQVLSLHSTTTQGKTHRMTRRDTWKYRGIHDSQVLDTMHPEVRVNDTCVLESRHATGRGGVVQRLGTPANLRLEVLVGEMLQVVIEKGIVVVLNHRGERLGFDKAEGEPESAYQDGDVVLGT
jgi:hypothetical protein